MNAPVHRSGGPARCRAVGVDLLGVELEAASTAKACAANASLLSITSRSPRLEVRPFFNTLRLAGIGPSPMTWCPRRHLPYATSRASGFEPAPRGDAELTSTKAAAPSLMPDALPAVTVPSSFNAGVPNDGDGGGPDSGFQGGVEEGRTPVDQMDVIEMQ